VLLFQPTKVVVQEANQILGFNVVKTWTVLQILEVHSAKRSQTFFQEPFERKFLRQDYKFDGTLLLKKALFTASCQLCDLVFSG